MTHLITGGSGFLGNLVANRLLERGETVKILDIWEDPCRSRDIEYINCDIRDKDRVERAMRGIDVVHHNVALVPLTKSGSLFWDVNVNGSKIAAQAAVNTGVKSFIHMSSSAIFGVRDCPITHDTEPRPMEIYGRAKFAGEQAVKSISEISGMPLIIIRPRTILGAGRLGIFQILFDWIKGSRKVYVIGDGNHLFQFVHAFDLMDAYMLALDHGGSGVYNIGTNRFGTLREVLENLIGHAGSESKVKALPELITINALLLLDKLNFSPLAPWHYLTYSKPFYFDMEPLEKMGWSAKYSNDEMFYESYDWFVDNYKETAISKYASPHRKPVKEGILRFLKKIS